MAPTSSGRDNQKRRTRQALLEAASRLMGQGHKPSFDEIAAEALVSRATAYRYFSGLEALLVEALLHVATPNPDVLFGDDRSGDPISRLVRVDAALTEMMDVHEGPLRLMLAQSLQRAPDSDAPARQNRRSPLIEAALEPARAQFRPEDLERLGHALALVIGTEAMVVFKDVLQLDDAKARDVRRWAIRALVEAARKA